MPNPQLGGKDEALISPYPSCAPPPLFPYYSTAFGFFEQLFKKCIFVYYQTNPLNQSKHFLVILFKGGKFKVKSFKLTMSH